MPTFSGQIAVAADDGYWTVGVGGFNSAAVTIDLSTNGGIFNKAFFHFPNVTVPVGATINSAAITIRPNETQTPVSINIKGEKAANPGAVTSQPDGDGRVLTTAGVTWNTSFVNGTDDQSTDISSIIQEIVNQAGWLSGNAMQLFIEQFTYPPTFTIVGEDGTHPAGRALLTINYNGGGGGGGTSGAPFWLFED